MKYINTKLFLTTLAAIILFGSCKKNYLDVNDDPNRVTETTVTPELIFPQAAAAVGARAASQNFTFLNNWLGYWSTSGSFAIDQTETSYNADFSFGEAIWQNHYGVLFDLYKVKTKALAKGDSVLAGAAMILSAKLWQELVDMFGDIPYTQAFQNDAYTQPAYDKAQDIYNSLSQSLDSAKAYMELTAKGTFASVDIVNHGDQDKWIKFANTLKLRLLIHQSEVPGFNPEPEIAKITDASGRLNILRSGESVVVNPGYVNETNKQSPYYANYGLTVTGAEANPITRANVYFVNLLNSTNDPRLQRYFKAPAAGGTNIIGTVYGLAAGNPQANNSSGIGPGLVQSPSQDQWIFTSVESLFLEAEAIARGWVAGDAQQAYEAAVKESFIWLGVPDATTAAATYLNSVPIAMWANAGSSVASRVKFIAYQKYIALAGIDPLEVWTDLRRLNMIPNKGYISANPSKVSNSLPVRLPYPQTEYTTNAANVNAEGAINIFTSKIFWQP